MLVNRNNPDNPFEFFSTPGWASRALFNDMDRNNIRLHGRILEPACGKFAIVEEMLHYLRDDWEDTQTYINCNDIQFVEDNLLPGYAPVFFTQKDYLNGEVERGYDFIITNPPFSLAREFCEEAIKGVVPGGFVSMLLPISYHGSQEREDFHLKHPACLLFLPRRPSFGLNKHGKKGSDSMIYAWYVWSSHPAYAPNTWRMLEVEYGQRKRSTKRS